jgi:hypothetical protein
MMKLIKDMWITTPSAVVKPDLNDAECAKMIGSVKLYFALACKFQPNSRPHQTRQISQYFNRAS